MKTRSIQGRDASRGDVLTIAYDADAIQTIERRRDTASGIPVLAPGFIDGQVNGFRGFDVNGSDVSRETILSITAELAAVGVTTWVPTIVTADEDTIVSILRCIAQARDDDPRVAKAIPSTHVEGPFISDRDGPRGAHDARQVRPIDPAEVRRWTAGGTRIGIITVSPHQRDASARIAELCSLGARVSIGHTHATPEQIVAAIDAGATLSTHIGNGIETKLPRHPNALWTQLADDRLTCGMIADGHHLPSETLEVMLRAKGLDGAFLISDATSLAGQPPGRYQTSIGGSVDLNEHGRVSLADSELLAGAAADLVDGLRNVVQTTSLSLAQALRLVTENPATVIPGTRLNLGTLRVGAPPDFVLLGDDCEIVQVIQSGDPVLTE